MTHGQARQVAKGPSASFWSFGWRRSRSARRRTPCARGAATRATSRRDLAGPGASSVGVFAWSCPFSGNQRPAVLPGQRYPDGRARRETLLRRGDDAQLRAALRFHDVIPGAAQEDVAYHGRLDRVRRRGPRNAVRERDVMLPDGDGGVAPGSEGNAVAFDRGARELQVRRVDGL